MTPHARDRPAPNESASFFDELAASWDNTYAADRAFRRRFQLLTSLLDKELAGSVPGIALDAGCGSGVFSAHLAGLGWRVEAIDSSERMIETAQRQLKDRLPAVSLKTGSIDDLPFPAEHFDLVVCLSALEYVRDDAAALRELSRVLRLGGLLLLTVPNRRSVVRIAEMTFARGEATLARTVRSNARYLAFQRHQYVPSVLDRGLRELRLASRNRQFWSVGFSGPSWLVRILERPWWAGMYGGIYVKVRVS